MPQRGPRKRQRSDADAAIDSNDTPIIHDKEYYREDGDCIILVDRVLFKIHRFLLERDASAFSNMFSMPQGNSKCQGNTDEDPLVLFDDVDDFRALCWVIYALPEVCLQQYEFDTANMQKLVSLYLISQKYHFESHVKFARELLQKHCSFMITIDDQLSSSQAFYFKACAQSRLQNLLRIAIWDNASTEDSFSEILQCIWLHRLEVKKESSSLAFEVAEALGLRGFLAQLYYLRLAYMKPKRIEGSNAYTHADDDLAPHRKLALYRGYWSLQCYWPEARERFISEGLTCASSRRHACRRIWKRSWETAKYRVNLSAFNSMSTFNPVYELKVVKEEIRRANEKEDAHVDCAQSAIEEMMDDFLDSLADHFLGPPP